MNKSTTNICEPGKNTFVLPEKHRPPSARSSLDQNLAHEVAFVARHVGPSVLEQNEMLDHLNLSSLDDLVEKTLPSSLRSKCGLVLPPAKSENEALSELMEIMSKNKIYRSFIGMGYSDCFTPAVIQRNILESPGWYTAYTPYQAEISQGRLEALLNFQTMVTELTSLEIANASLLDEATAAAEAMAMCFSLRGSEGKNLFFVSEKCHPQTIQVAQTRAIPRNIRVVVCDHNNFLLDQSVFGVLLQYPATDGSIEDYRQFIESAHENNALAIVATDLLSLTLFTPPGEFGADVAVGNSQRFGVPLGYGGPHAAFFATRDQYKRYVPGRMIGVSRDAQGKQALRMALQTREQHIRREKATSNICTAQVLLAVIASMYAVYHGPHGLKRIAARIHGLTVKLALGLQRLGYQIRTRSFFDTLHVYPKPDAFKTILALADSKQINLRVFPDQSLGISLDETTTESDVITLLLIFNGDNQPEFTIEDLQSADVLHKFHNRTTPYLQSEVFHRYSTEHELLRYIYRLQSRDLSLTTSMIPLGSCTMKLNATAEMIPLSWPTVNRLHPFIPLDQANGYQIIFDQLSDWFAKITGLPGVSLQPNAGSQGEFAGLLVIREFQKNIGQSGRNVCLIPTSAHGTNPASATLAGLVVKPVLCDDQGNIDLRDLRYKAKTYENHLSAIMVTYPSTHGVFEEHIREICNVIHDHGGQVYMDGANMNAQMGLCRPGDLGADVCHLNLHKTFCIPHGGGGPGMGPIAVADHLTPFLPCHPNQTKVAVGIGPVAASPWGSASILTISWMYIRLMGADGLTQATKVAILNANYLAKRLDPYFPVLFRGVNGFVAHECILDLRSWRAKAGIEVEDVAKRLMDYGFHSPTMSWPVPGTLMIEPTESESKMELDRFCDAMISIHSEMVAIASGISDRENNLLKNAPHTASVIASDQWDRPYSREQAAFPTASAREHKFWPAVGRIDNAYGDRNLVCTCPATVSYEESL